MLPPPLLLLLRISAVKINQLATQRCTVAACAVLLLANAIHKNVLIALPIGVAASKASVAAVGAREGVVSVRDSFYKGVDRLRRSRKTALYIYTRSHRYIYVCIRMREIKRKLAKKSRISIVYISEFDNTINH